MATVTRKVKGGKWYAIYTDQSGKQKWKTGYTDKAETQRLADRLENEARQVRLGDVDPQQELRRIERAKSIADHVAQYKASLQAAGRDKNHVAYTIRDIELFVGHSATTHAAAITRTQVESWKLGMIQEGSDSHRTINRRVGSLQALLKWLHGRGVIGEYVLHKLPKLKTGGKQAKRVRRPLTAEEASKLLNKAPADRADIYRFSLFSGARYSAIAQLSVSDVDLTAWVMSLKKKHVAGGTYAVPIHPTLKPILARLIQGKARDARVFNVMRREQASKLIKADLAAAEVDARSVDFHALRHTFITNLAKANVHPKIAMELAGHSSLEMTLGFYTHFRADDKVAALAVLS